MFNRMWGKSQSVTRRKGLLCESTQAVAWVDGSTAEEMCWCVAVFALLVSFGDLRLWPSERACFVWLCRFRPTGRDFFVRLCLFLARWKGLFRAIMSAFGPMEGFVWRCRSYDFYPGHVGIRPGDVVKVSLIMRISLDSVLRVFLGHPEIMIFLGVLSKPTTNADRVVFDVRRSYEIGRGVESRPKYYYFYTRHFDKNSSRIVSQRETQ